jgi:hypothetical protein
MPQVASTIASGAPPLSARRSDLPRRLLAAVESALSVDPAKRPPAARLATELREAFVAPLEPRTTRRSAAERRARSAPAPSAKKVAAPLRLERQLVPAGLAAVATLVGGSLLPFWPTPVLALLALTAGLATLRAPRIGLALALAAPIFPLGNLAQAAAVVYGVLALAWLAAMWRDARAGLAFCAGPLLAPLGLIALLPLAVQPAAGAWRRALHAGTGVFTAAVVAGVSGRALPLGGDVVADLGLAQSERPVDVLQAVGLVLRSHPAVPTTALALAIVAVLLPRAAARGPWGIAGLGALQVTLVLAWAPTMPWLAIVAGTWLLCGLLAARPYAASLRRAGAR